MTSKFEQLIEYVINDEEAKAKELFHDIVVEKSREIYENLMNEEEDEELDEESHDEKVKKDLEYDYKHGRKVKEGMDSIGGDAVESLMRDVSTNQLEDDVRAEEEGMHEAEDSDAEFDDEAEEDGEDMTKDMEYDHDEEAEDNIEDRVIDLEDKLDELMAEFEAIMGGKDDGIESDLAGEEGDKVAGDALAQDDTMAFGEDEAMMEAVTLDKVTVPKMGDDGANTKSVVPANSGARGMAASPVRMTGDTAQGRPAPKTGDLPQAGTFKNVPGKGGSNAKLSAATKPTTTQAAGVNTRTPFPKG
jgi:hypothetical protein